MLKIDFENEYHVTNKFSFARNSETYWNLILLNSQSVTISFYYMLFLTLLTANVYCENENKET